MFFIEGDPDGVTPGQPAEQYFKETTAPYKEGFGLAPQPGYALKIVSPNISSTRKITTNT
jgi:hypothetical protein